MFVAIRCICHKLKNAKRLTESEPLLLFSNDFTCEDNMKIHKRSLPETRKRLKINWRLFILSLVSIAVIAPALYFLHQSQMGRVSNAMKQRAKGFEESQDWIKSASSIETYLLLDPENREQKVHLAEILDKALPDEQAPGAYDLLSRIIATQARALGVCETDPSFKERESAIRTRMMQRLVQSGRFEDSLDQIAKLASPNVDPYLMKWLALSRYSMALENRNHSFTDSTQLSIPEWLYSASTLHVVDLLLKSIIDNPGDIEISSAIAQVCLGDPVFLSKSQLDGQSPQELRDRALSVMDKMLATNREKLEAWLAHFSIASRIDPVRAESDIRQALSMAPEDPVVLREAGGHFMERGLRDSRGTEIAKKAERLELAEKYYKQALENGSKRDGKVYLGLGEIAYSKGDFDVAIKYWEDGARVSTAPTGPLWFRLAQVWAEKRDLVNMKETLKSMDESIRVESGLLTKRGQVALNRIASQQWATYYALQGDFVRAAKYLEEVVAKDQEMDPTNRSEMLASLGMCYLRSGQYDRAVEAYQNASSLAPNVDERHRGLADALAGANRIRDAIDRMELVVEKTGRDHIRICELVLDLQKRNRPEGALWTKFDNNFKDAVALSPSDPFLIERPWVLDLTQLEAATLRSSSNSLEEAKSITKNRLLELSNQYEDSIELQRLVVQKLDSLGLVKESRELFEKIESKQPKDTNVVLTKIDYLLRDGMKEQAKQLLDSQLSQDPTNPALQSAAMRLSLGTRSANTKVQLEDSFAGNIAAMSEAGRALVESQIIVDDLTDQAKLANATKEWCTNIEVIENQLRELEGTEGTEWRYLRARRLLAEAQIENKTDLNEIEILTNYLIQRRPSWNSTYVLSALVEETKGNFPNAIRDHNRALRLGEQNIRTYERLAELMIAQGQGAELSEIIDRLGDRVNRSQRLSSIAISLSNKDQKNMLELAKAGTDSRPRDPLAWVWLGQVTEIASRGQPEPQRSAELVKAEQSISRARELSEDKSLPVFSAAFGLFLAAKQTNKIDSLLADLEKSPIESTNKYLALAEFYQVLDRMDLAKNALLEARKSSKDPNSIDDRMARLLLAQGKQDEAIGLYATLFANLPLESGVRRSYVTLLAARGGDQDWATIDKIYQNEKLADNPDDRRLRAELLARKGQQKDLAMAQYLLEALVEDPKNRTDQDRFRLASIYIRNAALAEIQDTESPQVKQLLAAAGKQLATLCRGAQVSSEYLYTYADFLIKQDRIVEANEIADRLNVQEPDSFISVVLRARLQKISGNQERAKTLVIAWRDAQVSKLDVNAEASEKANILASAGDALNELGASKEAEETLRQAFELDGRRGLNYVRSLARSEDSTAREAAIRYLLEKLKSEKSPEVARLLAGLLSVGNVPQDLADQGDEALSEAGSSNDRNAELLLSIADMWLAQKKSNKAIDAYKKIVKLKPNDVVALNNLAILLGEQDNGTEEALSLIDQAIRIAGKQPLLLDSKAAILMLANRFDEAVPILEVAASATNDPRVVFHLYQALRKSGRDEEASRVKSKVNPVELRKSILTPDDQSSLEEFEKENPK
jgi:Tfp pilus assembly protein PilF